MSSSDSEDDSFYGPRPPPDVSGSQEKDNSALKRSSQVIGPALPPGFVSRSQEDDDHDDDDDDPNESSSIGPLLPGQKDGRHQDYQRPSTSGESESNKNKREEWMTVIPDKVERKLGFANIRNQTSFSKRPVGEAVPEAEFKQKDQELKQALKEYTDKKRQSSLLDLYEEKMKKKKAKEGDKKTVRRPLDFDPDKDLHVRNIDEKQTKSAIEKSKLLNTRFSSGGSQFL